MTEDQIEREVEARTNRADKNFMLGVITQREYDAEMAAIAAWAEQKYRLRAWRV